MCIVITLEMVLLKIKISYARNITVIYILID